MKKKYMHFVVDSYLDRRSKCSFKRVLYENKIKCIEWPSYSSDLNLIEDLLGSMKKTIQNKYKNQTGAQI